MLSLKTERVENDPPGSLLTNSIRRVYLFVSFDCFIFFFSGSCTVGSSAVRSISLALCFLPSDNDDAVESCAAAVAFCLFLGRRLDECSDVFAEDDDALVVV